MKSLVLLQRNWVCLTLNLLHFSLGFNFSTIDIPRGRRLKLVSLMVPFWTLTFSWVPRPRLVLK